jgi:hypothetical protein
MFSRGTGVHCAIASTTLYSVLRTCMEGLPATLGRGVEIPM